MLTVTRRYHFESAHFLPLVPEGHKCKRMHGHNYEIEVSICGSVGHEGWLIDFFVMDEIIGPIIKLVDHHLLNEIDGLSNPTVENIAPWFFKQIKQYVYGGMWCSNIRVYETKDCWADYCEQ
jgi:6-pyruvoyltetrahydropterin/6-carboxytetrahydropterin synthase